MGLRKQLPTFRVVLWAVCVLGATAVPVSAAATFQGLGDLAGGDHWSWVQDLSADGSVAVGYSRVAVGTQGFRWTGTSGMVGLPISGPGAAGGVSSDGSVVVGGQNTGAYRWTAATGAVALNFDTATDVSDDGSVVVGSGLPGVGAVPVRWTSATGPVSIGTLPGYSEHFARAVSPDGTSVVGWATSGLTTQAFRWTAGTGVVGLGWASPGDEYSRAWSASADGSLVVGVSGSTNGASQEAFLWSEQSGLVTLGTLPGHSRSAAADISADGSYVVGGSGHADTDEAFFWSEQHGMLSLPDLLEAQDADLTGWSRTIAMSISADGSVVVGNGINPLGQQEAWIATLDPTAIPEPSSLALIGLAGARLFGRRRRPHRSATN